MSEPIKFTELWDRLEPYALRSLGGQEGQGKSNKGNANSFYAIVLYDSSAQKKVEYSVSQNGLAGALAAAGSGDVIWIPAGIIAGNHSIPAGVMLVGVGRDACTLSGQITLGAGAALSGVSVTRSLNDASVHYGVVGPGSGTAYLLDCNIHVGQAGAGQGYALRVMAGDLESQGCLFFGTTAGATWGGVGQWRSFHDRITATQATSNGQSVGAYTFDSTYEGWLKVPSEWDPHPNHVLSIDTVTFHGTPGAIKFASAGMGDLGYAYGGPLTLYKNMSLTVHTDDVISMWAKCNSDYRGERVYIKVVYTDGDTLIFDLDTDANFDWTQFTLTVPAEDDGKVIQRVYFGEYLDGWDNVYTSTWWFDDLSVVGVVTDYDPNVIFSGTTFEGQPDGLPAWGDRAVWDAALYPERHTNDTDISADSLHHSLGEGATQAAAGDHQNHKVEDLANFVSTAPAVGDIPQQTDWTEILGGAEALYDSADLTVDGSGDYANAYDKNMTNQWFSSGGPHWTTAAFSRKKFVSKVSIKADSGDWISFDKPLHWHVYGSNTGAFGGEETDMGSRDYGDGTDDLLFTAPRTGYRYYKITFPDNANLRINEIQFYTVPDEPVWENKTLAGAGVAAAAALTTHTGNSSNPHNVTKAQVGLGNVANILDKLDATTAPTVNDDSGDGYSVKSTWIDVTADKAYICVDATVGAAVWVLIGSV